VENPYEKSEKLNLNWFDDVIDSAPDVYNVIDRNGIILQTNSKNIVDGKNTFIGASIYPFFLPQFYENVHETIEKVFITGKNGHYELATGSNGIPEVWYMTNLAPIIRNGRVEAVAMYIRNITELKKVQQDLNIINEELERRVDERTRTLHEYANRLEASEKLNTGLRTANSQMEVFSIVIDNALTAFKADFGGIYVLKDDQLDLAISQETVLPPPKVLRHDDDSVIYKFFLNHKTQYLHVDQYPKSDCEFCSYIKKENAQTLLLVPLKTKEELVGVLFLAYKYDKLFSSDEEQLVNVFVEAAGNTLHRTAVMSQLEEAISARQHELNALFEIMAIASENEDLENIFRFSLEKIISILNFKVGAIHLVEGDQLIKKVVYRKSAIVDPNWMDNYFFENKLYEQAIQNKKRYSYTRISEKNLICLTFPIREKGTNYGLLTLLNNNMDENDLNHLSLITSFADVIGLVVANFRQRKRSDELLILEERQRLARDLHDSVSQSLYGLVISADVGNKLLKLKEYTGLQETLKDIEETALQSLREMRLMLFELRPLFFESVGLIGALDLRLNIVERRTGVDTTLKSEGIEMISSPLDLEIYGIATEALNNSLKHSKAHHIDIELFANNSRVHLLITDDGIGFDLKKSENGGIGFSSMKERANRIGGKLMIKSQLNEGTKISLTVPLKRTKGSEEA